MIRVLIMLITSIFCFSAVVFNVADLAVIEKKSLVLLTILILFVCYRSLMMEERRIRCG